MIPAFDTFGRLPSGVHPCTWAEMVAALNWSVRRRWLLVGLEAASRSLAMAGCRSLYLDGSFVTNKDEPSDFDGCWDVTGVDAAKLDPILLRFDPGRLAQKAKFRGELFLAHFVAEPQTGRRYLDFFQQTKDGEPKGIVVVDLASLP